MGRYPRFATWCGVAFLGLVVVGQAGGDADPVEIPETIVLGDVTFEHQFHFEALELECGACHHETEAADLDIPHPQYFEDLWIDCTTCHHESRSPGEPQRCSVCHHPNPFDIADETLSPKVVIHRSCWSCHEVGKGKEASSSCGSCHAGGEPDEET